MKFERIYEYQQSDFGESHQAEMKKMLEVAF